MRPLGRDKCFRLLPDDLPRVTVASGPFQYAVAEALALPDSYFDAIRADMLAKRDVPATGLAEAGFEVFRALPELAG